MNNIKDLFRSVKNNNIQQNLSSSSSNWKECNNTIVDCELKDCVEMYVPWSTSSVKSALKVETEMGYVDKILSSQYFGSQDNNGSRERATARAIRSLDDIYGNNNEKTLNGNNIEKTLANKLYVRIRGEELMICRMFEIAHNFQL